DASDWLLCVKASRNIVFFCFFVVTIEDDIGQTVY
ncbi:hypothetical protein YPPY53_3881, partial [Yersinia pestis PY-53]